MTSINFFLDLEYADNCEDLVDEVRGHAILLSEQTDINLRISALLEGTSVDFLFGARGKHFSSERRRQSVKVKLFLRELEFPKQTAIAEFYGKVYNSLAEFYNQVVASNCCCYYLVVGNYRPVMQSQLNEAFEVLYAALCNKD